MPHPFRIAPCRGAVAQEQEAVALRIIAQREAAGRADPDLEMDEAAAIGAGEWRHSTSFQTIDRAAETPQCPECARDMYIF
jgi:hypothetical protein